MRLRVGRWYGRQRSLSIHDISAILVECVASGIAPSTTKYHEDSLLWPHAFVVFIGYCFSNVTMIPAIVSEN
jgi:hypothetical protein